MCKVLCREPLWVAMCCCVVVTDWGANAAAALPDVLVAVGLALEETLSMGQCVQYGPAEPWTIPEPAWGLSSGQFRPQVRHCGLLYLPRMSTNAPFLRPRQTCLFRLRQQQLLLLPYWGKSLCCAQEIAITTRAPLIALTPANFGVHRSIPTLQFSLLLTLLKNRLSSPPVVLVFCELGYSCWPPDFPFGKRKLLHDLRAALDAADTSAAAVIGLQLRPQLLRSSVLNCPQ